MKFQKNKMSYADDFGVLALKYQAGDTTALDELIVGGRKYFRQMARTARYHFPAINLDDLDALVVVAAYCAAKVYDPDRGSYKTLLRWKFLGEISNWRCGFREDPKMLQRCKFKRPMDFGSLKFKDDMKEFEDIFIRIGCDSDRVDSIDEAEHYLNLVISVLTPLQQRILYLRYGLANSIKEISERTYLCAPTIRKHINIINRVMVLVAEKCYPTLDYHATSEVIAGLYG